jgi:hypothetical protein
MDEVLTDAMLDGVSRNSGKFAIPPDMKELNDLEESLHEWHGGDKATLMDLYDDVTAESTENGTPPPMTCSVGELRDGELRD